jgi:hypothetical protein
VHRDVGHTYLVISTFFLGWNLIRLDLLRNLLAFGSHFVEKFKCVVGWEVLEGESAKSDEGSNQSSPRATLMLLNKFDKENEGFECRIIGNKSDNICWKPMNRII